MRRALCLLLFTLPLAAGEPSPIEDRNVMIEMGRNRNDSVLQFNSFYFRGAMAHEIAQEWAVSSPKHQLGYTIPIYTDGRTGLGDTMVSYRYQLAGDHESRFAASPRISLLLPTRSAHFGGRSSGVQVSLPVTASLTPRIASHTNVGTTWYREGGRELNVAQNITVDVTKHAAFSVDAMIKHCSSGETLVVLRPGISFSVDGPGGVQMSPGIAFPTGGGVLLYVSLERGLD